MKLDLLAGLDNSEAVKSETKKLTISYARQAADHFGLTCPTIEIVFDLKGRTAGWAHSRANGQHKIRFNWEILLRDTSRFHARTVPHEVAHIITYLIHGNGCGHGREWRDIMRFFKVADATRTHSYNTSNLLNKRKSTRQRRHAYLCACPSGHSVSTTLHNKMKRGQIRTCQTCGNELRRK